MENIQHKLKQELHIVSWKDVAREFAFKRLCIADADLDLLEVATAMAEDNSHYIRSLMDNNRFRLATDEDAEFYADQIEMQFAMVIVSPFVLVQPKIH